MCELEEERLLLVRERKGARPCEVGGWENGAVWASGTGYTSRARKRIASSFTNPLLGFSTSCRERERESSFE